jgi:hypothetical protein
MSPHKAITAGTTGVLAAALLTVGVSQAAAQPPSAQAAAAQPPAAQAAAAACGELFDDFSYTSPNDPALGARHWTVRTNAGGPGVPGASWPASNISFPAAEGGRVLQLSAATDGTAGGTSHAEMFHQRKFFEGTYASRVRFTDTPVSGADGDHLVETFFTITPLDRPMDPNYGELDFEYLPNGGWGEQGPIMYETTWETYQAEPWVADNVHTAQRTSHAGWHDLVIQVSGGRVKYFIDGAQVADHGDKYYPETQMSINYNLWFIDTAAHSGGMSRYQQQVDWLYYAGGQVLSPSAAVAKVAAFRAAGTAHTDTVGSGTCTPQDPPPTPPDPADCDGASAWNWGTVYLEGQRATHRGHLWRARWWTQGSEPGVTAQWEDLGAC